MTQANGGVQRARVRQARRVCLARRLKDPLHMPHELAIEVTLPPYISPSDTAANKVRLQAENCEVKVRRGERVGQAGENGVSFDQGQQDWSSRDTAKLWRSHLLRTNEADNGA